MDTKKPQRAAFRPLVDVCADHGIKRTRAFQLARDGLIDAFKIGRRTFCYVESVEQLPSRIKKECEK